MVAKVSSTTLVGIDAVQIEVEAQVFGALRRFSIVGLPDGVLRESKERVRCAIQNSGFRFPHSEVVVSLAPAALPKYGSGLDLAIALSILAADSQIDQEKLRGCLVLGELALDGAIKPVPGVLAAAVKANELRTRALLVPLLNGPEATLSDGVQIFGVGSLLEAAAFLNGALELKPAQKVELAVRSEPSSVSFADVIGQHAAKRAMEIVAAGGHNLLMVGPPGSGKTMLAQRLIALLPPLSESDAIQVTKIYSALDPANPAHLIRRSALNPAVIARRPFRAPHHTTSMAGLIGGGSNPLPGEISLAHKGVLFLDELTEFRREVLEGLRQPLESKRVLISRAKTRIVYPADFVLVAAMNPCPCGRRGSFPLSCECSDTAVRKYNAKISGPLLDRIDLQTWVPPVPIEDLHRAPPEDPTDQMFERVTNARSLQERRFGRVGKLNAQMTPREMRQHCPIDGPALSVLEKACFRFALSARGHARVIKVARTIADLDRAEKISPQHIAEALSYRLPANS